MPGEVIDRVHELARRNPAGGAIVFGWRNGVEIEDHQADLDDLHDEDYLPGEDDSNSDDQSYASGDGTVMEDPASLAGVSDDGSGNSPANSNSVHGDSGSEDGSINSYTEGESNEIGRAHV
jgi:hypothetical protein